VSKKRSKKLTRGQEVMEKKEAIHVNEKKLCGKKKHKRKKTDL